jgi:hypothetical protein
MLTTLPVCQKRTAPYVVELVRGPHDGLAHPMDRIPLSNSITMSNQGQVSETSEASNESHLYEWKDTQIRMFDGLPVMVFRYHYMDAKSRQARGRWRRFWQLIASRLSRK